MILTHVLGIIFASHQEIYLKDHLIPSPKKGHVSSSCQHPTNLRRILTPMHTPPPPPLPESPESPLKSPLPPCACCILIFILMPTLFRGGIQLIIHILVRVLSQHVHRENDNRGAESRQRILPQVGEEGMTSPRVLSVKWHGFIYHRIPEWRCDSLDNEFFEMRRAARDEVGHYFPRIIWARTAHRSLEHTNTEVKISR